MLYTIYSITIQDTDLLYIGSTKSYNERVARHKRNVNLPETHKAYNYKLYKAMREHGIEKCIFKPLEHLECDKSQALERETHWLKELMVDFKTNAGWLKQEEISLNSQLPVCKVTKAERDREYYATHKDERKKYLESNRERIAEVAKKHYDANRESIIENAKEFRKNNPEKIKEFNKKYSEIPPIQCECGGTYTYKHKSRHLKTEAHRLGVLIHTDSGCMQA